MIYSLLYLSDILSTLDDLSGYLIFCCVFLIIRLISFLVVGEDLNQCLSIENAKYWLKKSGYALVFLLLTNVLIPQKQTLILISSMYIGENVITEVSKSPLYDKAYKLAEAKLDELLDSSTNKPKIKGEQNEN